MALEFIAGHGLVASFGVTAWAIWSAAIFSQYAPFSWVVAGFAGMAAFVVIRWLNAVANRIRVRAKYDAQFLEHGGGFNPLDKTFERKRIYINDFVLPSHPFIEGKTFIDCDLIGPANIYFHTSNLASPIRPPKVEAVWLHPTARFNTGFTFKDCIFRNCSFQRITMFASIENYLVWKDNANVDWIGVAPTPALLAERQAVIAEDRKRAGLPPLPAPAPVPAIEHNPQENYEDDGGDDKIC